MARSVLVGAALVVLAASGARAQAPLRWCVSTADALAGCERLVEIARANWDETDLPSRIECVRPAAVEAGDATCLDALDAGEVEVVSNVDAGDVSEALRRGDEVRPVVAESYDGTNSTASYFAVAAVPAAWCESFGEEGPTLADLAGTRSCHTGYRKTAGWIMPVGTLLATGAMEAEGSDLESAAAFFAGSCAPFSDTETRDTFAEALCANCGTEAGAEGFCCRDDKAECPGGDAYYDYPGAFRCMAEGAGDVAFIKHTTIPDFTRGGESYSVSSDWAWPSEDAAEAGAYRLLCREGGCAPVDAYEACNLAEVPAHATVVSEAVSDTDELDLRDMLYDLNENVDMVEYFYSGDNTDGLFKGSTKLQVPILTTARDYVGRAGDALDAIVQAF